MNHLFKLIIIPASLFICLYFFIVSLELMSSSFKLIFGNYAKKLFAENASNSSIVKNLRSDNISTSSLAISSSYALFAEKSFYIKQTEYSKNSAKSQYTSKNVYAYINFQVTGIGTFDIYSWKNIRLDNPIKWKQSNPFSQFYIYFDNTEIINN